MPPVVCVGILLSLDSVEVALFTSGHRFELVTFYVDLVVDFVCCFKTTPKNFWDHPVGIEAGLNALTFSCLNHTLKTQLHSQFPLKLRNKTIKYPLKRRNEQISGTSGYNQEPKRHHPGAFTGGSE